MLNALTPTPATPYAATPAFAMIGAMAQSAAPSALLMAVLDEIDYGVLVLDTQSGRLHHANRLGTQECRDDGPLSLERGCVRARRTDCQRELERALSLAAQSRRSLVSLHSGADAQPVAVVPLTGTGERTLALLVFGKRQACETLSVGFFARLHGLTPAEAAVLQGLCEGQRPSEVARHAGVAVSTVRTQVSSIRQKTATASIRDLINKVATLPPMTPALRNGGATH